MKRFYVKEAYLPEGWAKNVRFEILQDGRIGHVQPNQELQTGDINLKNRALIPAMANLHSHGFQRAMVGLTGTRKGKMYDSFWSWRDVMYGFLNKLSPEQIQAITAYAYIEMLEAGYASVAEFHYLHRQLAGIAYDNPAELSETIIAAAESTGLGITFYPVLYLFGGAGRRELEGGQLRFGHDSVSDYCHLIDHMKKYVTKSEADYSVGVAPHSLRAVCPETLQELIEATPTGPIHIHIAEQQAEIDQIKMWLGSRPVEWLLEHFDVSDRWCLIHATHLSKSELSNLATSGAIAGLCPITEADLGDGTFKMRPYHQQEGRWGIGTDSNVNISVFEELRQLEYSQRLEHEQRNVLITSDKTVGETLYRNALVGGAQALSRATGQIKAGEIADLCTIDRNHPTLAHLQINQLFDGLIFGRSTGAIVDVWSAGRHCVQQGVHVERQEIQEKFQAVMEELLS